MRSAARFTAAVATAAAVVVALVSAPAMAATVTHAAGSSVLSYQGGFSEQNEVVVTSTADAVVLTETGPATLTSIGDCQVLNPDAVSCPLAGLTRLDMDAGDLDDQITNTSSVAGVLVGAAGADTLLGGPAADRLDGGTGTDTIDGGGGDDEVYGATLQDPGAGLDGDLLTGGLGNDRMYGSGGADRVDGGAGDDTLDGGGGADQVRGGDGRDVVVGGAGDDLQDGGPGDDQIGTDATVGILQESREGGNDLLAGGPGDDVIAPGPGVTAGDADVISGGDGVDSVSYGVRMLAVDVSKDGGANDGGVGEGDNVGLDVERVAGGLGDDLLRGSDLAETLDGGPGDDRLEGLGGPDELMGDGGTAAGTDTISGGGGNDRIRGESGGDALAGGEGADALDGGDGVDDIDGGPGADDMNGGPGRDEAGYTAPWPVTVELATNAGGNPQFGDRDRLAQIEDVEGGDRWNTITGTSAANVLEGGTGADYLDGRRGVDRLDGGRGADLVAARDDRRDEPVACGPGTDFAIVDRSDRVVRRGANRCEQVDDGRQSTPRPGRVHVDPRPCVRSATGAQLELPAMGRPVPLRYAIGLPTGYGDRGAPSLTAADCALRVTATPGTGMRAASADVSGDEVSIRQSSGRAVTTTLALAPLRCGSGAGRLLGRPSAERRVRVRTRKRPGRWQVRGRYSLAASQGTDWTTVETCAGTRTIVRSGSVRVRDRLRRRSVVVRAGRSYLARSAARSPGSSSSGRAR